MSIQIVEIAQPSVIDTVAVAQPSTVAVVEVRQGPQGADGGSVIDSSTQSDGTADLDLLNVTTATATVTGTLTADHIHGNLAGELYAHIRAGENLAKGDPVYISGSHGTGDALIAVASKADASDPAKMPAVGIMSAAVTANANGHMVIAGTIPDLNTSAYAINSELYVAAGGGMTATPPSALAQPVARVERSNANNGAILVKVNGLSAIEATPGTLVRRDASGNASFEYPTFGSGFQITEAGGTDTFGMRSAAADTWSMYGPDYGDSMSFSKAGVINFSPSGFTYGTGAAAAHRTALGLGTGDSPTFTQITVNAGSRASNLGGVKFADQFDLVSLVTNSDFGLTRSNVARIVLGQSGVGMRQDGVVSWTGTTEATNAKELSLLRDAANTLAQRNGNAAQESRIYGTYTSSTNYERLSLKYNAAATAYQIGTEKGSAGGVAQPLQFQTDGTTRATITATGNVGIGTTSPESGLHVSGVLGSNNTTYDSAAALKLTNTSGNSWLLTSGVVGVINGSFCIRKANTALPAVTIAGTTNNVGIGTTSPSALLDVNSDTVRVRTARTPASATAAGNAGDICWDADYIYVCTATNTWKRTAISTWP